MTINELREKRNQACSAAIADAAVTPDDAEPLFTSRLPLVSFISSILLLRTAMVFDGSSGV